MKWFTWISIGLVLIALLFVVPGFGSGVAAVLLTGTIPNTPIALSADFVLWTIKVCTAAGLAYWLTRKTLALIEIAHTPVQQLPVRRYRPLA